MLLDYYDRIIVINLKHNPDRLKRLLKQIEPYAPESKIRVQEAIYGQELFAPAWWKQGNGAWGCLQSHIRALQDAWQSGDEKTLIIEDDAILDANGFDYFQVLINNCPDDWAQMYLGGQHQHQPEIEDGYFIGRSVNRTHAYAVQRHAIPKILQHIQHYPDYGTWRHVDHQLELAHMRKDWKVVCPVWWLFGQGENKSGINGRSHPDKWWDWADPEMIKEYPWVVVDDTTNEEELAACRHALHFGWSLAQDGKTDVGMQLGMSKRNRSNLTKAINTIAREAWDMRKLPAVYFGNEDYRDVFLKTTNPKTLPLSEVGIFDFKKWSNEF
jgi:hypothetical protein